MAIGESVPRVDARAKVTGRTRFAADTGLPGMRVARYLRSPIAHGRVKHINIESARSLPGVDAVFTFHDVPDITFATAGHAWNLDAAKRDKEDRKILTGHVRYHGDEVAIVVAKDDLTAQQALNEIDIEYEEYPPILSAEEALMSGAREIHAGSGNQVGEHMYTCGDISTAMAESDIRLESSFSTQMVQHCHMETVTGWAYMDDTDHIVIHSSTQIPHICRRIVAQALDMPMGQIRIIKPPIGGGFGNKQDVLLEPMLGFLASKLRGIPVKLELSREECLLGTRVRHPFRIHTKVGADLDGTLKALDVDVVSNTGAYASHGHSIASAAGSKMAPLYPRAAIRYHAKTHYSNQPAAGAMRGYGAPQATFAVDSTMEEIAHALGMDPVELRLKNAAVAGDPHPLSGKPIASAGIKECLERGREHFGWNAKRQTYAHQTGNIRRGIGVACFSYGSNTWPVAVEIAGCRMILNQDGSVNVQTGTAEIGQGSDTIIAQLTVDSIGINMDQVHVQTIVDTDVSPYDPGAFASRQSHVFAYAVTKAAKELKQKILSHAAVMTKIPQHELHINGREITGPDDLHLSLNELALDAYYHQTRGEQLTSEVSHKVTHNAYSYGATFIEIEVDIPMCRVEVKQLLNVHDAGRILNPMLATGQVQGGASMGLAGATAEELLIDPGTGQIRNNNLLDYKIPTCSDLPYVEALFVETDEPNSACGHKSLGEPPLISIAPALRNAIWHATGVKVNRLPMGPKELFIHFREAGLL